MDGSANTPSHWQRKCLTKRGKREHHRRSLSAPAVLRTPEKKIQKCWTDTQMKAAVRTVQKGLSGINQAAVDHGIPKTTLKDRLSGRVQHGVKPGPKPYLDNSEVASFIKECASMGYGKTQRCDEHCSVNS